MVVLIESKHKTVFRDRSQPSVRMHNGSAGRRIRNIQPLKNAKWLNNAFNVDCVKIPQS